MKAPLIIALFTGTVIFSGCNHPNKPVQTARDLPDSVVQDATPGSTPVKADSINASPKGPDQMVPENSIPTQTAETSKRH